MILKQERPEMDDFERKKKFGCKRKNVDILSKYILSKNWEQCPMFLTLAKYFAYSFVSEHFM